MIKFYFTSLFVLFFSFSFSQSYPYLNASTGNENEYPVDKDTNIYMFQGTRISKTDKNFNVIWSNVYSGLNFTNLLLSKTGSIYFVSGSNTIGKLNPDGSLGWIKPLTGMSVTSGSVVYSTGGDCKSIYLDAGNNIVVTGNMNGVGSGPNVSTSYYLKCDTNGVPLKLKVFKLGYGKDLVLVNDSSGVYKFLGSGPILSATLFQIHSYSDVTDNFISYKGFGISWGSGPTVTDAKMFRSKLRPTVFYMNARVTTTITDFNAVVKITDNAQVKWTAPLYTSGLSYYITKENMEEDNKGNVLASISCGGSCPSFTSAILKIDSNGVRDPFYHTMLKGYSWTIPQLPKHAPRVIHDNNYYFDIWGYSFPNNPLTVQKFNSSFLLPCGSALPSGTNGVGASSGIAFSSSTIIPVSSFTMSTIGTTVTPSAFSVNPNFCTVLGTNEMDKEYQTDIYPNPVNDKLFFKEAIEFVKVYDVNGKEVLSAEMVSDLNVNMLSEGIYFVRVRSDKGEFTKKFIKN